MNISSDLKYERLFDEDEKEEGKPFSLAAPLIEMYIILWAS